MKKMVIALLGAMSFVSVAQATCEKCETVSEGAKPDCFTVHTYKQWHCPLRHVSYSCPADTTECPAGQRDA